MGIGQWERDSRMRRDKIEYPVTEVGLSKGTAVGTPRQNKVPGVSASASVPLPAGGTVIAGSQIQTWPLSHSISVALTSSHTIIKLVVKVIFAVTIFRTIRRHSPNHHQSRLVTCPTLLVHHLSRVPPWCRNLDRRRSLARVSHSLQGSYQHQDRFPPYR